MCELVLIYISVLVDMLKHSIDVSKEVLPGDVFLIGDIHLCELIVFMDCMEVIMEFAIGEENQLRLGELFHWHHHYTVNFYEFILVEFIMPELFLDVITKGEELIKSNVFLSIEDSGSDVSVGLPEISFLGFYIPVVKDGFPIL